MVAQLLENDKEVTGIYVSSANCIPICEYIEKHALSERIVLVTSDIFEEMRRFFENGVIKASLYQDPVTQAKNAFENLYKNIAYGKSIPETVHSSSSIIIRSNLSQYL